MSGFENFLDAVANDEFEEEPVPLQEFLYDEDYLDLPQLSDYQETIITAMTQVYDYSTLVKLWGKEEANERWKYTSNEVVLQLGKGSGKDFVTAIAFARVVYLLLCLKEPARYFGKPRGNSIDILNIAVNAKQAKNVFFKEFKQRIETSPWFVGRYSTFSEHVEFDKNITAYSGHSERESWEGYNFLLVVLDEIAGFNTEEESDATGAREKKTAEAIYDTYSATVASRFPKFGKVVLLSFPRYKGDFIQKHYDSVVENKETVVRSHTFKMKEEMADGIPGNELLVEWEEDHITDYARPGVYALRRPTWYINPLIEIEDLKQQFFRDPQDAKGRFACMPPEAVDAFFKDKERVEAAFPRHRLGPFTDTWRLRNQFKPRKDRDYYVHVDLAYKHDRAAVALAHVSDWARVSYGSRSESYDAPRVVLDAVRWWTPRSDQSVNFQEIEDYILSLKRMGFNLKLVTFDRWGSVQFRQRLEDKYGIMTDNLSVAKPHYEDLQLCIAEGRLIGYDIPLAREELLQLRIIKGNKVDHPTKGSKDVSDAIAGSVYNCVANAYPDSDRIVEVQMLGPGDDEDEDEPNGPQETNRREMPKELQDYFDRMETL